MDEIPLFPLNTVLFPGMPLPLHIFEQRYKQMITLCQEEQRPFGVVFLRRNVSVGGPVTTPHSIGCTARIIELQPLQEGRMLIMTIGQKRFRIISVNHDQPYLVGQVEFSPLQETMTRSSEVALDLLRPLVTDYLDIVSQLGEVNFNTSQLPDHPGRFLYMAAGLLQIPQEQKQALLEVENLTVLSKELYGIYHREVSLMRHMPREDLALFSVN
jgi:Lon protease-like protein